MVDAEHHRRLEFDFIDHREVYDDFAGNPARIGLRDEYVGLKRRGSGRAGSEDSGAKRQKDRT